MCVCACACVCVCTPLKQRKERKSSVLGRRLVRQLEVEELLLCVEEGDTKGPGELGGECANFL